MAALLFLTSLALLDLDSVQARTLASESWRNKIAMVIDYGRPVLSPPPPQLSPGIHELTTTNYQHKGRSPPPPPELSPSESQFQTLTPYVAGNPSSNSSPLLTIENDYEKAKLSPPPPPAQSKSPTQSTIDSSCVDGNTCGSSRQFLAMKTSYGREQSPPPPPTPSVSPTQTEKKGSPCGIGRPQPSPPPPASSKSPTQLEVGFPCLACSSSTPFIATKTDYGKGKLSPPPAPKPSKPPVQTDKTGSPYVIGKPKLSPPPPTSSQSPTQSEIDSPCVACSSSTLFIATKTDYGEGKLSPPPAPKPSKPPVQTDKTGSPYVIGKRKLSPPPPPTSSKSPTHAENTGSPCAAGTGNPCNSFISMVTDHDNTYERPTKSPPPSPKASPPEHYDLTNVDEQILHVLSMFI